MADIVGQAGDFGQQAGGAIVRTIRDMKDGSFADVVSAAGFVYNGAVWIPANSASAANLAAQSGVGAELATPPGMWIVSSIPAAGTAASASKAAGAAGVRHVCTALSFLISATTALAGITTLTVNLRDGATGVGTILASWQVTLPAGVIAAAALVQLSGLNIPGSAATAMTFEGSAGIGNLMETAVITGYDAS